MLIKLTQEQLSGLFCNTIEVTCKSSGKKYYLTRENIMFIRENFNDTLRWEEKEDTWYFIQDNESLIDAAITLAQKED